ncbi:hypothetical protein FK220_009760 [Flavobacteriaceae bacterium TP-CH-4]|uniref:Holin-X, holin superfamily III n=1 Tax=Pelagihabitans pacificus TaxID=2696054 RepID=A0A967EAP5_9FLAO|nr:hypothetical protein [Pelagihabitans pacificus]NHF59626.1 hypothetical protein [Pelagihabitans pacificus]
MAYDELKRDLTEADADVRSYLEHSEEYFKLKVFKVLMGSVTAAAKALLVGAATLVALLMLSFAASYAFGLVLGSNYQGFLIVGLFYVLVAILCYLFRDKLDTPLLRKFSDYFF